MVDGKRPWRKDLYERYMGVVNSEGLSLNKLLAPEGGKSGGTDWVRTSDLALMKYLRKCELHSSQFPYGLLSKGVTN